jgi:hypothetical protein
MSKCRINKYKASSGGFNSPDKSSCQQNDLQAPFAQLMAARDDQDRRMTEPVVKVQPMPNIKIMSQSSQTIVPIKSSIQQDKKSCIDIILGGDF